MATGFCPRRGGGNEKSCPPRTTHKWLPHPQQSFILSSRACGCLIGNCYLQVLQGFSLAPEFSSDKTGLLFSTLLPHVLDLLVSKYMGRADSKPPGANLPDRVPCKPTPKMQQKCSCLNISLRGINQCVYLQLEHTWITHCSSGDA